MLIQDYFNLIRENVRRTGGMISEFVIGNVRRASNFLGGGWIITSRNNNELDIASVVNVNIRILELENNIFFDLRRRENLIINRINNNLALFRLGLRIS